MMQFSTTGLDFSRFCSALRSQLKQRRGNKAVARVLLSSFEHRLIRFTTVVILLLCCSGIYAAEPELDAYKLGPEDVVTVVVSRHPEFSGDYYIPSDGVISIVAVG
ncbi:MAG TPA: polysaccharide biosynthesis/export family protein, partial [Armatimonadota bacterium]|nr:polysaccharide biosynthesis/export family protein [Armatimonadota bacterium]